MKDGFIKVCVPSIEISVGYVSNNVDKIIEKISECKEGQIIVFPELCMTGATIQDLVFQTKILEDSLDGLEKIALATEGIKSLVFVGMPYKLDGKIYDAIAVINDGYILGIVPKDKLGYSDLRYYGKAPYENILVTSDDYEYVFGKNTIFKYSDVSVGVVFSDEVFGMSSYVDDLVSEGANIICVVGKDYEIATSSKYHQNILTDLSKKYGCSFIYASSCAGESTQDYVYSGFSCICEMGDLLAVNKPFAFGDIYTEVDIDRINNEKNKKYAGIECSNDYEEVEFDLEYTEQELTRKYSKTPFIPEESSLKWERAEEILNIQAYGLVKRIKHVNPQSLVIGLSGGLDSCLALLVIIKACDILKIDHKNVIAISMPCFGTSSRTKSNASVFAEAVGVTFKEINIKDAVTGHLKDIGHDMKTHDVAYENAQARERTQILMDIANMYNGLVIGTGDLSELALGFATYNGDHMSMYGVNSSIPKTLVRHLVRYVAENEKNIVLKNTLYDILDTPVSPELLPSENDKISQVTEDIVGPYELHDFFMYYALRYSFTPSKIYRIACHTFKGLYENAIIKKWLKVFYNRFFNQQFKRSCSPDGPKVGTVSLSPRGDYLMSSDSVKNDFIKEIDEL